ncbi:hypothetical protein WT26_14500 [Burkholderia cepacia]|uniref:DUF3742 family protein n=3 Tax=Burkholderia TaxID=32008 RepID=A0A1B4PT59_BURCE|nr:MULTISPECIES: DUF3742 family protein [Burkholderia cepacia complex]AOK17103.1 hypothetical protein WT26_14500 [Burkholderia cepacia]AOK23838.1 hypothetical protein WK67_14425 [Burkholderia ubonensis]
MTTPSRPSWAHRFGEWAGQTWRWLARQDRRALAWLTMQGLPVGAAKMVSWAVKLLVLVAVFYAAFWLALLVVFAIVAAWLAQHADDTSDEERPQWRNGLSGYGLYRGDTRIDPGSQDDE